MVQYKNTVFKQTQYKKYLCSGKMDWILRKSQTGLNMDDIILSSIYDIIIGLNKLGKKAKNSLEHDDMAGHLRGKNAKILSLGAKV